MPMMLTCATLREPTREDICRSLAQTPSQRWPQDEDEMLRLFRLMMEDLLVDPSVPQRHLSGDRMREHAPLPRRLSVPTDPSADSREH